MDCENCSTPPGGFGATLQVVLLALLCKKRLHLFRDHVGKFLVHPKLAMRQIDGLDARQGYSTSISAFDRRGVSAPYRTRIGSLTRFTNSMNDARSEIRSSIPVTKRIEA